MLIEQVRELAAILIGAVRAVWRSVLGFEVGLIFLELVIPVGVAAVTVSPVGVSVLLEVLEEPEGFAFLHVERSQANVLVEDLKAPVLVHVLFPCWPVFSNLALSLSVHLVLDPHGPVETMFSPNWAVRSLADNTHCSLSLELQHIVRRTCGHIPGTVRPDVSSRVSPPLDALLRPAPWTGGDREHFFKCWDLEFLACSFLIDLFVFVQ